MAFSMPVISATEPAMGSRTTVTSAMAMATVCGTRVTCATPTGTVETNGVTCSIRMGNGRNDDCYVCDHDQNGARESGFVCDDDRDGKKEACYSCDANDDGTLDVCKDPTWNERELFNVTPPFVDVIKGKVASALGRVPRIGGTLASAANNASVSVSGNEADVCCPPEDEGGYQNIAVTVGTAVTIDISQLLPWKVNESWTLFGRRLEIVAGPVISAHIAVRLSGKQEQFCDKDCWEIGGSLGATLTGGVEAALRYGKVVGKGKFCCARDGAAMRWCHLFGCRSNKRDDRVPPGCNKWGTGGRPQCTGCPGCILEISASATVSSGANLSGAWNSCKGSNAQICWTGLKAKLVFRNIPFIGDWEKEFVLYEGSCARLN